MFSRTCLFCVSEQFSFVKFRSISTTKVLSRSSTSTLISTISTNNKGIIAPAFYYEDQMIQFWKDKGVHSKKKLNTLLKHAARRSLFRKPDALDERIAGLEKILNIPSSEVVKMVARFPLVLAYRSTVQIKNDIKVSSPLFFSPLLPADEPELALVDNGCLDEIEIINRKYLTIETNLMTLKNVFGQETYSMISQTPQLLAIRPSTVKAKMDCLNKYFSPTNLHKVLRRCPHILCLATEKTLEPNLLKLKKLFQSTDETIEFDTFKILAQYPFLICSDVDQIIRKNYEKLKKLFPNTQKILFKYPCLLCYDIERSIVPKIEQLRQALKLSSEKVTTLLEKYPYFLAHDIEERLIPRINQLAEIFSEDDAISIILRHPTILQSNIKSTVKCKIEKIESLNLSANWKALLVKYPQVLTSGFGVFHRLKFLKQTDMLPINWPKWTKVSIIFFDNCFPMYQRFLKEYILQIFDSHYLLFSENLTVQNRLLKIIKTTSRSPPTIKTFVENSDSNVTALDIVIESIKTEKLTLKVLELLLNEMEYYLFSTNNKLQT
eukprot:c512_g1_i1.p1 GENE.c512_g1_i1~~c512_g1_i1.p1  ORF type:complete len:550 (+),score=156.82 c512_g1_i1:70-1719(+)